MTEEKKPRGWPKGKPRGPRKKVEHATPQDKQETAPAQEVSYKPEEAILEEKRVVSTEEKQLAEVISESRGYTEEELQTILLGLENVGNKYDWAKNADEFRFPDPLYNISQFGTYEQAFRWIDTKDETCMIQIHRSQFRWTPVNLTTHGRLFKDREKRIIFNKHGGIMKGPMLLCWMPGKLHQAWRKIKQDRSNEPTQRKTPAPGTQFYDPASDGSAVVGLERKVGFGKEESVFTGTVHEDTSTHPDTGYEEQGEYV